LLGFQYFPSIFSWKTPPCAGDFCLGVSSRGPAPMFLGAGHRGGLLHRAAPAEPSADLGQLHRQQGPGRKWCPRGERTLAPWDVSKFMSQFFFGGIYGTWKMT